MICPNCAAHKYTITEMQGALNKAYAEIELCKQAQCGARIVDLQAENARLNRTLDGYVKEDGSGLVQRLQDENAQLKEELERTEKVYRMNRDYVSDAKAENARLRSALEYCFEVACKHDVGELHEGMDRKWCSACSSWVYASDWIELNKAREALGGGD